MAMWAIVLVSVWRNMGYYMVIYLAALQGVPRELYEAATVDGANKWQQFTNITIPQLQPTTFFASIMMIISCFKIFDVVAIMTEGGPGRSTKMLVYYIYACLHAEQVGWPARSPWCCWDLLISRSSFRSEKFAND